MNNHSLQNTEEEAIAPGSTPAAPAAHTRYLSSPAGATLHGKTQGFLPRLSPKTKPMSHPCSHYIAFCNFRFQTRISRRTWQHKTTMIMQPLHCDLQPESQETHRTTHTWTTTHCRTQRRNQSRPVRPQPHPPHTRGTFHRRPEPLYTEKHKVSCPGFPPKRSPCHIHAAITLRFATSGSKPASLDAHGNTKQQWSCSHYTAICNQRVKKRIELRTHEQPLIAEHRGGTNRARFDPSRTRRTHEVPFIAGRSHFTRKNTRFPAPAFPQNEAHVTSMQPLQCVLPPFIECSLTLLIVMWCQVTHHPSLSIVSHFSLSCDVKSHTTLHWV